MTLPGYEPSYYTATAHPAAPRSALAGDLAPDVAVIGGGYTGLSAALYLARRGFSVAVLETHRVGWGASGRNGGQMITGLAPGEHKVRGLMGAEAAKKIWALCVEANQSVRDLIAANGIDCDYKPGYILAAAKPDHLRWMREEVEIYQREYGYDAARIMDETELRATVASQRFHGGIYDSGSGHLHPLNYALGLAAAAEAAGATIHENSQVLRLSDGPNPVLHLAGGAVRPKFVVLAGNAYLGNLAPSIAGRIMPVGTYIMATEPLGEGRARALIANDACVCDSNFVLDYFRLSADHRMLFGGRVSYSTVQPVNLGASMHRRMIHSFPQLADTRCDHAWGGYVDISMNRMPDIGKLPNGPIYYAQGFSGQGVALTGLMGKLIAEAIAGTAERYDVFARIPHREFPGGTLFRTPMLLAATLYQRLRDVI